MKYRIPAVALSLVLALGGCRGAEVPAGAADNSETWKIGISFPTTDLIYRETMMELLKEYEKDHPEVDFIIRDGESSQRRQNRDVLDMLEESVDGIILIPYTMEAPVPVIRYANEKNVPVLILDNEVIRSSTARTIGFVGADHEKMGEQAAEASGEIAGEAFPGGNILECDLPDRCSGVFRCAGPGRRHPGGSGSESESAGHRNLQRGIYR